MSDRPLMSPAALLGNGAEPLPERAVLVFDDSYVPRRGRRRKPAPFRQVAIRREGNIPVAVVATVGPGAPTVAVTVEFLHHLGVRSLISVGLAGALVWDVRAGGMLAVERAVSEDGTAASYGQHLRPDHSLNCLLSAATVAPSVTTVSTDTPLVHTATDLARLRKSAEVIEMEIAALFSVAKHCGVAAASLVVISDRYTSDSWIMGDPAEARSTIDAAVILAITVLSAFDPRHETDR